MLKIKIFKIQGRIKKYDNGVSFLIIKSKKKYFIPLKYSQNVIHGDYVFSNIYNIKNYIFAKPTILIKSYLQIFIGKIIQYNNFNFIIPDYPKIKEKITCIIKKNTQYKINHGDWIQAKLIDHPLKNKKNFTAKMINFITHKNDFLIPWKVILSHYNLYNYFPKVYNYKTNFDKNIIRVDLTHLEFMSIDDENTKDIDDTFFIQKKKNNIILTIAISDPTAYIIPESQLDIFAQKRLFTNYLPGLNIPMFPTEFSENLFSLQPGFKKPVLACKITLDQYGNIKNNFYFFLAWIKSHYQLTYNNVSNWIQKHGKWVPPNNIISNQLILLYKLYKKRIKIRKKTSILFQEYPEYKFNFSNYKNIINISKKYRNLAHKMIEEAMIIANISAARFLSKKLGFGIYNIHLGFSKINIKNIFSILTYNNINYYNKNINTLNNFYEFKKYLHSLSNIYIENRIKKYQLYGSMSITPKPHFILGVPEYLTWTSPIRKYSDIINHRLIKNVILNIPSKKPKYHILLKIIKYKKLYKIIKNHINNWLYIKYIIKNNNLNKIFLAQIFDITPFGMKLQLIKLGAYVFIPNSLIHNIQKELICDQKNGILFIKNKELYRVSNIIKVILINVKWDNRSIIAKPI